MFRTCLIFMLSTYLLHAGLGIQTTVNTVDYRGDSELAGSVTLLIFDEHLTPTAPGESVYVVFTLDHNSLLGQTLVELGAADPAINQPIYLPMRLDGEPGAQLVAASDAVSIVRWVAGEKQIWVEVSQAPDQWISENGTVMAPSELNRVSFSFGLSARQSDDANDVDAVNNNATLPFSTRASNAAEGDYAQAVSTLLCLDLSNSNLLSEGNESLAEIDFLPLDHHAALGNGVYSKAAGVQLGISFFLSGAVVVGKSRTCSMSFLEAGTVPAPAGSGMLSVSETYSTDLSCISGGNLATDLYPGSYLTITITTPDVGFPMVDPAAFVNLPGSAVLNPDSAITVNGVTLFQQLDLVYTGASWPLSSPLELAQQLNMWYNPDNGDTIDVSLAMHVALTSPADEAPYDAPEQNLDCSSMYNFEDLLFTIQVPSYNLCLLAWPLDNTVLDLVSVGIPCIGNPFNR